MAKTTKTSNKPHKSKWKPDSPYNDLPTLPPLVELETRAVLKACIPARAALAELKQAAEMIPNQAILINTLPLLESQASNEIENIVTTTDKLFQHQHQGDNPDSATKEALRYTQSLYQGFRSIHKKPLHTRTAEEISTQIKNIEMKVRRVPGTALGKDSGEIVYTPPEGEDRSPTGSNSCTTKPKSIRWFAWRLDTINSKPFTPSPMATGEQAEC